MGEPERSRPGHRRILILGGGYVGMYAALRLRRRLRRRRGAAEIVVVNPENFMQYQPFLPEVASGLIDPRAVVVPLRRVLRGARLVVGEAEAIDLATNTVTVRLLGGETTELGYDVLVYGVGSRARVLPIPGLEHAVGFKDLAEAIWLRNRVLTQLDRADELEDHDRRRAVLTFVFVGAGFAGIEALGELEDLARDALAVYPRLSDTPPRWVMIEAGRQILPELPERLADYARSTLEARGIEIRTQTQLAAIEHGRVKLSDGTELEAETVVWTAGVAPSPLAAEAGLPTDERGRVRVDAAMRVIGIPDAWAAGDTAAIPDLARGGVMPPTAQHALREARHLADNVVRVVDGRPPAPFRYANRGMLCSLGHFKGIADPFGIRIRGFPAWFLHRTYHLLAMPTIGRRVRIAMDWTVALVFPRDIAQLGSLEHPREGFRRAARRR